jgi:aminoglycoside phosphotransferase (APT) family kinase protein
VSDEDAAALTAGLAAMLPGNPEVRVTGVASVGANRRTLFLDVIRNDEITKAVAQIAGFVLDAADIGKEARLLRAAEKAGVVLPHILADDANTGTIISEYVEGESIPRRILRLVEAQAGLGSRLTSDCGTALAMIHQIPIDDFRDLNDLSNSDRYADEMEQLLESLSTPHPTFRLGVRWLRRHKLDAASEPTVIHGDFRLGNFLASDQGISAVLDWELTHLGDPMEDLAWLCLRTWRFGADDLAVGGFGSVEELRSAYEKAGGEWRDDAFQWWTVARTLWWGLGLARQVQAYMEGASNSIVLAASGRRVVELEYDLLCLMDNA